MKKNLVYLTVLCLLVGLFTSCSDDDDAYFLKKEDIKLNQPEGGFVAKVDQLFKVEVETISDEGLTYEWFIDNESATTSKNLEHIFTIGGEYDVKLVVTQNKLKYEYPFIVVVSFSEYVLKKEDIKLNQPEGGFVAKVDQLFKVEVETISDEGLTYEWLIDNESATTSKNLEHMFAIGGEYDVKLVVTQNELKYEYPFTVVVSFPEIAPPAEGATAYITKVFDFMPAVGQFTNKLPLYVVGDTQETMNGKVLETIGNNKKGMISLGGFGGYVVVGFDHTIPNIGGKRDFRVLGNAFYAAGNPNPDAPVGGSCEPGIIMVAYDSNGNGIPDDNEWYEIEGSAHQDPTKELWYEMAKEKGNDVNLYRNYELTYYKSEQEPTTAEEKLQYIRWEDNKGNSGYKVKNNFHNQAYYPQWATGDKLTFKGTCLPQNGIDESGKGTYFVVYKFHYGYADNEMNTKDDSAIDIDWAVNSKGQKVSLPGVDFIKIYTGVNQENGWIGENSTEITGVEDLHILGVEIDTRK